ncbi:MAG: hypothetical protein ACYC92_06985 [Candidatus Acidiferrales bacterium]
MHLAHFAALLLCAALISVALASLAKPTTKERVTCAIRYFALFVVISVALAWLMYPFSH